jgi:AmmeMemoRadiSam system protein A
MSEERRRLLAAAREALLGHFSGASIPRREPGDLVRHQGGAFVTLRTRDGDLRGCVGVLESADPLSETVTRMAVAAAFSDRRFDPLREDELGEIVIEISALGALRRVRPEDVEIGRDGLLVREGGKQGVLLPQVATEHCWDRETFLDRTCGKAGLPADAWRGGGTTILAFSATVFREDDPTATEVEGGEPGGEALSRAWPRPPPRGPGR